MSDPIKDDPYLHLLCPRCGSGVDTVWEQLGKPVVCERCGETFTAESPSREGIAARSAWREAPGKTWPAWVVLCLGGLLCLLVAVFLWYVSIHQPLEEMRRREPRVSYSMQRIVFIPLFALGGAGMVIAGLLSLFFRNRESRSTSPKRALSVIIFVLLMVPGWFLYSWFEGEMKKEGYEGGILSGASPRTKVIPVPKMDIPGGSTRPDTERLDASVKKMQDEVRRIKEEARKRNESPAGQGAQ